MALRSDTLKVHGTKFGSLANIEREVIHAPFVSIAICGFCFVVGGVQHAIGRADR
jgi:hypothetical protein